MNLKSVLLNAQVLDIKSNIVTISVNSVVVYQSNVAFVANEFKIDVSVKLISDNNKLKLGYIYNFLIHNRFDNDSLSQIIALFLLFGYKVSYNYKITQHKLITVSYLYRTIDDYYDRYNYMLYLKKQSQLLITESSIKAIYYDDYDYQQFVVKNLLGGEKWN